MLSRTNTKSKMYYTTVHWSKNKHHCFKVMCWAQPCCSDCILLCPVPSEGWKNEVGAASPPKFEDRQGDGQSCLAGSTGLQLAATPDVLGFALIDH